MFLNLLKKAGSVLLVATLVLGSLATIPVSAAADNIEIILKDVTNDVVYDAQGNELVTLKGEAKIKVSIKGAGGDISAAQVALAFDGGLKYKSIDFMQGENNPPMCAFIPPNAALANSTGKILPSIVTNSAGRLPFTDDETDLFIITFTGNPGDSVTLSLDPDSVAGSYVNANGVYVETAEDAFVSETAVASSENMEGIEAIVKLTMDEIDTFQFSNEDGYADSKITLTITNESTESTISTVINTALISKGGHYYDDGTTSLPVFLVKNTVVGGATYTVELKGNGYVTYKMTGVTFEEPLELTNADFVPGDVNMDGIVDSADKNEFVSILNGEYNDCADFNRDGKINMYDNIFGEIDVTPDPEPEPEPELKTAPAKMYRPSISGGKKKITLGWSAPNNGGSPIKGYTIKYGTSSSNLNKTETVSASVSSKEITGLSEDTKYYVQIAAFNEIGTGEFSDVVNAKTDAASDGGSGGGGGGGGGGAVTPIIPSTPTTPDDTTTPEDTDKTGETVKPEDTTKPAETFTDLDNYAWAKDSIYTLKSKGIISGVSDTEYAPANYIKRGDFILILTRMLGINDAFTENFADVPASSYYYNAIGSAKAAGIAKGSGDNFMPENTITRQDLITLAYRAFLSEGYITETDDLSSLDVFADKDMIADYAKTAMASMVKAGIIQGSDGYVNPLGNATRAEVAVMCSRLVALMN